MDFFDNLPEINDAQNIERRESVIAAVVASIRAMHDILQSPSSRDENMRAAGLVCDLTREFLFLTP